jgi:Ala-tRNA(Pro) deacylase
MLDQLRVLLDVNDVPYETLSHREAFTAQEVAAAQHVPGAEMAKVVMALAGDRLVMTVLPATARLDVSKLARAMHEPEVRLAAEHEFVNAFPNCEAGAMPPFGGLFGLPVYVDERLTRDRRVVFQAGDHTHTIRMAYADFAAVAAPVVADIALQHEEV